MSLPNTQVLSRRENDQLRHRIADWLQELPGIAQAIRRIGPHLLVGGSLIGLLIVTAIFAPWLAPYAPEMMQADHRLLAPSLAHPFGTDALGRDLFSRVVYGARVALLMALPAVLLGTIPGIGLGLLSGYYRGWLDHGCSRVMDAWMAFPGLLLAIVMVAWMGPSLVTTVVALSIIGIPGYYRLARNGTLSTRHELYVEAAQTLGYSDWRIILRHVLPNLASPLLIYLSLRMGSVLLAAGGLSFIGLGAQPPTPEWGVLLAAGRDSLDRAWWLALFPGMAIAGSVLGFNLLGDGLRDWFDVKSK